MIQTCCGWRCCCRRRCRCRCCRRRSVDAARCAFGSRSTLASLVRTEENIEGSPVDCHVRWVFLTEPKIRLIYIFSIFLPFEDERDMWERFCSILFCGSYLKTRTLKGEILSVNNKYLLHTHFSFPIFMKSLPLLQLEFLAVRVNAEQEKFSLHLLRFPRWECQCYQRCIYVRSNIGSKFLCKYSFHIFTQNLALTLNLTTHLTFLP